MIEIKNKDGKVLITINLPNLRGANLSEAYLSYADLSKANLSRANLSGANLIEANLSGANLSGADLRWANLRRANLIEANLSGAKGLTTPQEFLSQFEKNEHGIFVYKRLGNTEYQPPCHWEIEPGAVLTEVCNPLPTLDCACGINFGTLEWCKKQLQQF